MSSIDSNDPIEDIRCMLASTFGIEADTISHEVVATAVSDPLWMHHFKSCTGDDLLIGILRRELAEKSGLIAQQYSNSQLLRSAASAALRWLAAGGAIVSEDVLMARLSTCHLCPHKVRPPKSVLYHLMKTSHICELCGCDIDKKARLSTEKCPDSVTGDTGRWPC